MIPGKDVEAVGEAEDGEDEDQEEPLGVLDHLDNHSDEASSGQEHSTEIEKLEPGETDSNGRKRDPVVLENVDPVASHSGNNQSEIDQIDHIPERKEIPNVVLGDLD